MRKKILVFPLVVLLIVSFLSFPVSALGKFKLPIGTIPMTDYEGLYVDNKGNGVISFGTFAASKLSPEGQNFMREWGRLSVSGSDRVFLIYYNPSVFYFGMFDSALDPDSFFVDPNGRFQTVNSFKYIKYGKAVNGVCSPAGDLISSSVNSSGFQTTWSHSSGIAIPFGSERLIVGGKLGTVFRDKYINYIDPTVSMPWYFLANYGYYNQIMIEDDLEDIEPTPVPTRTPAPTPKPIVPSPPVVPPGNKDYVLYDTDIWMKFFNHVSKNIGAVANIGFLIFGVWFVWRIIPRIVRRFTHTK